MAIILSIIVAIILGLVAPAMADTRVVGDSLTHQTYESGGWYVDSANGRQLRTSRGRVSVAVAQAPAALVVALGSNDVSHRSTTMVADVTGAARRPVPCVVITTVKVLGVTPFYGSRWREYARRWNQPVRASGAVVADWNEVSRGRPGWFLSDGLHLTLAGERAYDALLRASVALCPEPV